MDKLPNMLIVDSDTACVTALTAAFDGKNSVLTAKTAASALKIIEKNDISVLLMDIALHDKSGYELLKQLKKRGYNQRFPTVVITSQVDVRSRAKLYDLGSSDIIPKPFHTQSVVKRVDSVLEFFGKNASKNGRNIILIADDSAAERKQLAAEIQNFVVLEADNGEAAIEQICANSKRLAAVVLDVIMPKKSGVEVLEFMRSGGYLSEIPVIFVTSSDKTENELRLLSKGALDVLKKPISPKIAQKRITGLVNLFVQKRQIAQRLEYFERKQDFFTGELVDVLSALVEYRSLEARNHILRMRVYTHILLTQLVKTSPDYYFDKDTIAMIADSTALHDVGKIVVPDVVLNKNGRLTADEFEIIKQHPIVGSVILSRLLGSDMNEYMRYAYDICRFHHERYDGSGYPDGLRGDEIPIWAQVASIADVYDALSTDRVYKTALTHAETFDMIYSGECGQFSPLLLDCLRGVEDRFEQTAKKYRDQKGAGAEYSVPPKLSVTKNSLLSSQKYFALLGLLNQTVLELEEDGKYRLAYPSVLSQILSGEKPDTADKEEKDDSKSIKRDCAHGLLDSGSFFADFASLINSSAHPKDREVAAEQLAEWQECIKNGSRPAPFELRLLGKDGYHWHKVSLKPVIGDERLALVSIEDKGDAERLEQKIKEDSSRLGLLEHKQKQPQKADKITELLDFFGDCVVEYDLSSKIATYYLGGEIITQPFSKKGDLISTFVHPDDLSDYQSHLARLLKGIEGDFPLSISIGGKSYRRMWLRSRICLGSNGANRAICSIIDADKLLWHVEDIQAKSQIDQMTGSLNKAVTESQISAALSSSNPDTDRHALLLLDIDDFKLINDTFGHLTGDSVIKSIGRHLHSVFPNEAVGRIGGDEFVVLVKNDAGTAGLKQRIHAVFAGLAEISQKSGVVVSVSMGVSRYPKDGTDYKTLFLSADTALYSAKSSGKGRYSFFSGGDFFAQQPTGDKSVASGALSSLPSMLLDMTSSRQSIERVLDFAARGLHLGCIMVVKNERVLHDWQADSCYRPYCGLGRLLPLLEYSEGAEEVGEAIVCSDADLLDPLIASTLNDEGLGAFILVPLFDKGAEGFIVFSDQARQREWQQSEIKAARQIAKMFTLLNDR